MPRGYAAYLADIMQAIERIEAYTKDRTLADLSGDTKTQDALIKNLLVIGEAVKGLPQEVKEKAKDVPWDGIAGLRDRLGHQYFDINMQIVWDFVKNELPLLKLAAERLKAES